MRFRFADQKLESLYTTGRGAHRYAEGVVAAFLRVLAQIDAAVDERDLYGMKGLHYEKLRGRRAGERSVRLNQQWRLILRPDQDEQGRFLWVIEIVDYH